MTPRASDLGRALLLRELQRSALALALLFASAGVAAAWMSIAVPSHGFLAATLLRFDHTLAVIAAIATIMRVIERLGSDHDADWLLQLVAAGASRTTYVMLLPMCVAAGLMAPYATGAMAFAATLVFVSGTTAVVRSVLLELPLVLIMLSSAAAFGAALAAVWPDRRAAYVAIGLLLAPWLGLLLTLGDGGGESPVSGVVTAIGYPPPPLYLSYSPSHLAYVVTYIAIMLGIGLVQADRRIGRRA